MATGSPPTNSSPSAIEAPGSIAADLANQYAQLYGGRVVSVVDPATGADGLFALVPKGLAAISVRPFIDEYREAPVRRRGTATLRDLASFLAHVQRFKSAATAIFALPDRSAPSLTAVFDYHPAGGEPAAADFGAHRAVYACPLSDEWKAWAAIDGKPLDQGAFASFVEDRITDVVVADGSDAGLTDFAALVGGAFASPSTLIELSRGLQVNVDATVRQAVTLATGEISVQYQESHRDGAGAPLKIANLFVVAIPVFFAGAPYRIPVRLRYRVQSSRVVWTCHLYRADRVFDHAFTEMTTQAAAATECPVFSGQPET